MIGLIVVAHGRLAAELLLATEHVVGPLANSRAIEVRPNDDHHRKQAEIMDAIAEVDQGEGVIVVTDMFGGSPSNLAIRAMRASDSCTEVLYGANLPMLVKLAKTRCKALSYAMNCALEAGHKYLDGTASAMARQGSKPQ